MSNEKKLSEQVRDCAYIVPDPHPTETEAGECEVLRLNYVADEIAAPEKRLAAAAWQPIETAPKDGTELLLCSIHLYSPRTGCWATYHPNAMGKAGWRTAPICGDKLNPTHWMPLPPPPQENTHD